MLQARRTENCKFDSSQAPSPARHARRDVNALRDFSKNLVRQHTKVLDQDDNWNVLLYKEALYITRLNSPLNSGLKASRDLVLFR